MSDQFTQNYVKEIGKEMHSMMLVEKIDTYFLGQKMYTHHFPLPRLTASGVCTVLMPGPPGGGIRGSRVFGVTLQTPGLITEHTHPVCAGQGPCIRKEQPRGMAMVNPSSVGHGAHILSVAGGRGSTCGQDLQHLRAPNAHE